MRGSMSMRSSVKNTSQKGRGSWSNNESRWPKTKQYSCKVMALRAITTGNKPAPVARHRSGRYELRIRRKQTYLLRAKGHKAGEILVRLKQRFPSLTINKVYDDIEYTTRNKKAFAIFLYAPDFDKQYEQKKQIDQMIRSAWTDYYSAKETGDGDSQLAKLRHIAELALAKVNIGCLGLFNSDLIKSRRRSRLGLNVNLDRLKEALDGDSTE